MERGMIFDNAFCGLYENRRVRLKFVVVRALSNCHLPIYPFYNYFSPSVHRYSLTQYRAIMFLSLDL